MSKEEERLRLLKDVMSNHRGKAMAIPSSDISSRLGVKEGETYSHTRSLIIKAMKKFALPIAATNSRPPGYFYIANKGIVMPLLDSKTDAAAARTLKRAFPRHKIVGVSAREILLGGGNIHCITQQVPR